MENDQKSMDIDFEKFGKPKNIKYDWNLLRKRSKLNE